MREETWLNDFVFVVEDFLSADECKKYIDICEDTGFEEATVTTSAGVVRRADVRNNDRVMFKNQEIADWLWERTSDFVPTEYEGRHAIGLNEMLRFYRYDPGQRFDWHQDFPYERDNGERSYLTMLVYLSDGFEGGETSFDDSYSEESFDAFHVQPKQGLALFFEHQTHHKGEPVLEGRKYVLRTDVMYAAENPDEEFEEAELEESFDDVDNW